MLHSRQNCDITIIINLQNMKSILLRTLLASWIFGLFSTLLMAQQTGGIRVILDADTGNEVDDLFAITRALIAPEFDVLALNSAQWQNSHWAVPNTLENSQRLNVRILAYLNMSDIPHPRGAHARLFDWGQDVAQHSAAAYNIIREAHNSSPQDKLNVISIGALTNVASALLIDPSIAPNIRLYFLGTRYNFEKHYFAKNLFNCMMDLHAIDVVLDQANLELHIMPANTAIKMNIPRETASKYLRGHDDLRGFLYNRWLSHLDAGYNDRIIWDLSAIYAVLHPEYFTEITVDTPPENTQRKVFVYRDIDEKEIQNDFWQTIQDYFE